MAIYEPIQSSQGFDGIASQRQWWASQNNATERANFEAYNQAQRERNAWLARQQDLQRQDRERADRLQAAAKQDAQARYNFGQEMQFNRQKLAAQIEGDKRDASAVNVATMAKKLDQRFNEALGEIEQRTYDPKNYADLTPEKLTTLNRMAEPLIQEDTKDYFSAVALAQKLAKEKELTGMLDLAGKAKDAKENSQSPEFLRGFGDLQAQAAELSASLAPFKDKDGYAFGVMPDPKTGLFTPPPPPPWIASRLKTMTQTNASPTVADRIATWVPRPVAQAPVVVPERAAFQPVQTNAPVANALPNTPKVIDRATAMQFKIMAGGDNDKARKLAIEAGYTIPQLSK